MISHHDKCVFVHIPKCAGQSIEMFFLRRAGLDWATRAPFLLHANDAPALGPDLLAHLKAHHYVENKWMTAAQFNEYFKFAFVRNPWDRLASFYRYRGYDWRCSFSRFVQHHLPRQIEKDLFLCPQVEFVNDKNGKLLVDFIGRFETLEADFATACRRIGISDALLPHVNTSRKSGLGLKRWLKRRVMPYRDMYDSRSRKLVAKTYKADIEAFEYDF